MSTRPMHAEGMAMTQAPDRRREPRFAIGIEGCLNSSHGESTTVLIAEVSLHGCRISCGEDWLRPGMFVSIGLGDEPPLEAIVRWIRSGSVGMEFLWPIPPERREWHEAADLAF